MKNIHFHASLLTAAEGGKKPRRLSLLAYAGGVMPIGGKMVLLDLAGLELPDLVPILADHANELDAVVGSGEPAVEDGKLFVSCTLADGAAAEQVLALMESGVALQSSVGVEILESRPLRVGESIEVNGQTHSIEQPTLLVTSGRLREVSIVPIGADHQSSASLAAQYGASVSVIRARAAEAATERSRIQAIQGIADQWRTTAPQVDDLAAGAIAAGDSASLFEAKLKSATRNLHMISNTHRPQPATNHVLQAALLLGANKGDLAAKEFGERAVEAARRMDDRSLLGIFRTALRAEGRHTEGMSKGELIKASLSTYSIPALLSDAMGRSLLSAYKESPASWRSFAKVMSAANFKPQSAIRPSFIGGLEQVAPGGQIRHGTLGESVIPWRVDQFAKMIAIDRTTVINDDLSFISDLGPSMGRAAARSVSDLVWATILADSTHFDTDHGNLLESDSELSQTSLAAAVALLRSQRDAAGNNLDIMPHVLVVDPHNETTARAILNSEYIQATEGEATGNSLQNVAALAIEPRIGNDKFTGADELQWFLFASPMDTPAIVGFLDGKDVPTVESEPLGPDRLGVAMRVIFDYGFSLGDYRAAVKGDGSD